MCLHDALAPARWIDPDGPNATDLARRIGEKLARQPLGLAAGAWPMPERSFVSACNSEPWSDIGDTMGS